MRRAYLAAPFLAACAVILAAGLYGQLGKGSSSDTPVHAANVFFDGVNHADYRETCSVWAAARHQMAKCESGLTVQMASAAVMGEFGLPCRPPFGEGVVAAVPGAHRRVGDRGRGVSAGWRAEACRPPRETTRPLARGLGFVMAKPGGPIKIVRSKGGTRR